MSAINTYFRKSLQLNALFGLEGAASFGVDLALAAALGLGTTSDALYAALSLPVAVGRGMFQSLTNSFMGLFAEDDDISVAYNYAITLMLVAGVACAAVVAITSRWWLSYTLLGASEETLRLSMPLAGILAWLIAVLALSETLRAIFYNEGNMYLPSAARVVGAVVTIAIIIVAAVRQELVLTAWGLLIGGLVEFAVSMIGLRFVSIQYRFAWPPSERLSEMVRTLGWPILGKALTVVVIMTERALASFMGPGAVTSVTYSRRIIQMLERFVFRGFVISTIQSYGKRFASGWKQDLRLLLLISLPMFAVLATATTPVITAVFERGNFGADSVATLSAVFRTFAFSIPLIAISRIPFALAYARKKTFDVFVYFAVSSAALLVSEALFIFVGMGPGLFGIAQTISMIVGTIWLFYGMRRDGLSISWARRDTLQMVAVASITLAGSAATTYLLGQVLPATAFLTPWITVLATGLVSLGLVVIIAFGLHLPEANLLRRPLRLLTK